jgi:hypothetical protein
MSPKHITYQNKACGKKKDNPLRQTSKQDENWQRDCCNDYILAVEIFSDPNNTEFYAPDVKKWFNSTHKALPPQPRESNKINSPRSMAEGILEKLNNPNVNNGRDLSRATQQGFRELSIIMSKYFEEFDLFREIIFEEKNSGPDQPSAFPNLFGRKK